MSAAWRAPARDGCNMSSREDFKAPGADGVRTRAPSPGSSLRVPVRPRFLGLPLSPPIPVTAALHGQGPCRGKRPTAQFPARLGHSAPALARTQATSAQLRPGLAAGGGWGLGRWQPGLPRLCWPGAVPSPNSSEVEVAWEPGCCVQGSGAGWDRCGCRGLWNRCGSRGRQPPADTHSAVPPARPSSPPTSTRAPRRGDGTLQSQGRGAPLGRPGRGAHLCERPWQGLRRGGRRGGRGHLAPDQVCRASVLHLVR